MRLGMQAATKGRDMPLRRATHKALTALRSSARESVAHRSTMFCANSSYMDYRNGRSKEETMNIARRKNGRPREHIRPGR